MLRVGTCLFVCALAAQASGVTVDYPVDGSIFPPDIIAPTFLWRDSGAATVWRIEVSFGRDGHALQVISPGERMPIGEVDERCAKAGAVPPTLTTLEAQAHSWKPDDALWADIKRRAARRTANIT